MKMFYLKENYVNPLEAYVLANSATEAAEFIQKVVGNQTWERVLKQGYKIEMVSQNRTWATVIRWGRYAKR